MGYELPKYCSHCAEKLKVFKKQNGFNTQTGKPAYIEVAECPEYIEWEDRATVLLHDTNPHTRAFNYLNSKE